MKIDITPNNTIEQYQDLFFSVFTKLRKIETNNANYILSETGQKPNCRIYPR